MTAGGGAMGAVSSSSVNEHTGTKPRRHAIPIVHPITKETLTFEPQTKSTSSALEIKAPTDIEHKPAKATTVILTAPPPTTEAAAKNTDKSVAATTTKATTTTSAEIVTQQPLTASTANDNPIVVGGGGTDKTDQQMQTEACPAEKSTPDIVAQPTVDSAAIPPEENDDTDADTPELEHDDETHLDRGQQTRSANIGENITKGSGGVFVVGGDRHDQHVVIDSDTDPTTETDVKSMSQQDDDAVVIKHQHQQQRVNNNDQQQFVEASPQPLITQNASIGANNKPSNGKHPYHQNPQDMIPTTSTPAAETAAAVEKPIEDSHNNLTEDSSKTMQKKEAAAVTTAATAEEGSHHNMPTTNKELSL